MKRFALGMCGGVVITIVLSVICSFLFVKSGIELYGNVYNQCSIYGNSGCDFLIPSPSDGQISELENKSFIDTVVPFYLTQAKTSVNGKDGTENVIMLDSIENMSATVYNDARLIKGEGTTVHSAVADFAYAEKYNISVGDIITVAFGACSYEYSISSIYEKNSLYQDGVLLVNWSELEKQDVIDNTSLKLKYSAAWVRSSDYVACEDYFKNEYKPLGRLKDRSEFDSDEAYYIHANTFNSASFASEITDFSLSLRQFESKNEGFQVKVNVCFAFAVVLPVFACILKVVFWDYGKREKHLIRKAISSDLQNRKKILLYKNAEIFICGGAILAVYAAYVGLYKLLAKEYIKISLLAPSLIVYSVAIIVSIVIIYVVNCFKFKQEFKWLVGAGGKLGRLTLNTIAKLEAFAEKKLCALALSKRARLEDAVTKAVMTGEDAIKKAESRKQIYSALKEAKKNIELVLEC